MHDHLLCRPTLVWLLLPLLWQCASGQPPPPSLMSVEVMPDLEVRGHVHLGDGTLRVRMVPQAHNADNYTLSLLLDGHSPLLHGTLHLSPSKGLLQSAKFMLSSSVVPVSVSGTISPATPPGVSEWSYALYEVSSSVSVSQLAMQYHASLGWSPQGCPSLYLNHSLVSDPPAILNFRSSIIPMCPEGRHMAIDIHLESSVFPMANLHLGQIFDFDPIDGGEHMRASHPLFETSVHGQWNTKQNMVDNYVKSMELSLTQLGQQVWPHLPTHLQASLSASQTKQVVTNLFASLSVEHLPHQVAIGKAKAHEVYHLLSCWGRYISVHIVLSMFNWMACTVSQIVGHVEVLLEPSHPLFRQALLNSMLTLTALLAGVVVWWVYSTSFKVPQQQTMPKEGDSASAEFGSSQARDVETVKVEKKARKHSKKSHRAKSN